MQRTIVLLAVLAIVLYVARRVWVAVLQLRVGAVPEGVDVPEVTMVPDRGWQVTRAIVDDVAVVRVEHPFEGVSEQWEVPLREPGAMRSLDRVMSRAGVRARDLSAS